MIFEAIASIRINFAMQLFDKLTRLNITIWMYLIRLIFTTLKMLKSRYMLKLYIRSA